MAVDAGAADTAALVDNTAAADHKAAEVADEAFCPSCRTVPFLAYPSPGAGFGAARLSAG